MVKAVIFDCFGVLATDGWLPFKAKHFSGNPASYKAASKLVKQSDTGLISLGDFVSAIARLAGVSPEEVTREIRQNVPNEPLLDYIRRELKPRYKLGFLSNVADDYMRRLFSQEQRALFDAVTLSYKIGFIKPEPQAYIVAAQNLGTGPEECVLVDDSETNVNGARRAGMQAVLYRDFDQMKSDLETVLTDTEGEAFI